MFVAMSRFRVRPGQEGMTGDALNALLVAAGHNIRLLLRAMATLLRQLLHRLLVVLGTGIQDRELDPSIQAPV